MKLIFTDLDNTLIYSKRRVTDLSEFSCVERYNNEDLSFMKNSSIEKLKTLMKMEDTFVIPITTRVLHQYNRINLPQFKYTLISNGGILLVDEKVDYAWYNESKKYALSCIDELLKALMLLGEDAKFLDDLFVFVKSSTPDDTVELLLASLDTSKVSILQQGSKIYVMPKTLNKGDALKRFRGRLKADFVLSAGDNTLDFSMAEYSDKFITSNNVCGNDNAIITKDVVFSDELLDYALQI